MLVLWYMTVKQWDIVDLCEGSQRNLRALAMNVASPRNFFPGRS